MKIKLGLVLVIILNLLLPGAVMDEVEIDGLSVEEALEFLLFDEDELIVFYAELEIMLQELARSQNGLVGISYYCLTTGYQIAVNGDALFNSASTIKLPTHMLIAEAVHMGDLSWFQPLIYDQSDWLGGSGILQKRVYPGMQLTLYETMRYSIVYSDNIAHRMLTRALIPGFVHDKGGLDNEEMELTMTIFNRYLPETTPSGKMLLSPNQLTTIFRTLYHGRNQIAGYEIIFDYMMNTSWQDRFKTALTSGYVAHTPGWNYPYSHDSGIFFTSHPYVLVVMTEEVESEFITKIGDLVFNLHLKIE